MTEQNSNDQKTSDAAQEAVEQDIDIQARIREITLKALTERELDREGIKAVIQAVTKGVTAGVGDNQEKVASSFKQALNGMDEALASSAQAARLASEEAIGKINDFTEHEFSDTLKQLENLEDTFLNTVNTAVKQASNLVSDSVKDLTSHLKHSGSAAGKQSREAATTLRKQLAEAGKDSLDSAVDTGKQVGNQIANIASGILAGMADALNRKQ